MQYLFFNLSCWTVHSFARQRRSFYTNKNPFWIYRKLYVRILVDSLCVCTLHTCTETHTSIQYISILELIPLLEGPNGKLFAGFLFLRRIHFSSSLSSSSFLAIASCLFVVFFISIPVPYPIFFILFSFIFPLTFDSLLSSCMDSFSGKCSCMCVCVCACSFHFSIPSLLLSISYKPLFYIPFHSILFYSIFNASVFALFSFHSFSIFFSFLIDLGIG